MFAPDILVVEDTKSHMLIVQYVLQKMKLEARYAEDGLSAIDMIENKKPDLLILDLWLPGANGDAVLDHTQALYDDTVNTIITSAQSTNLAALHEQFPAVRASLVKPYVPQQLIEIIEATLTTEYPPFGTSIMLKDSKHLA